MNLIAQRKNLILFALAAIAIAVLYADILHLLYLDWLNDPNYSHGFLVPLISAYFAWQKKEELEQLSVKPANSGLLLIFFALAVLLLGVAAQEFYTRRASFVFLLA